MILTAGGRDEAQNDRDECGGSFSGDFEIVFRDLWNLWVNPEVAFVETSSGNGEVSTTNCSKFGFRVRVSRTDYRLRTNSLVLRSIQVE